MDAGFTAARRPDHWGEPSLWRHDGARQRVAAELPSGRMIGLMAPTARQVDLARLTAGARKLQAGSVDVFDGSLGQRVIAAPFVHA